MYVCLCSGATAAHVRETILDGACTTRAVADACGAGAQCGRCRHTVRTLLTDVLGRHTAPPK